MVVMGTMVGTHSRCATSGYGPYECGSNKCAESWHVQQYYESIIIIIMKYKSERKGGSGRSGGGGGGGVRESRANVRRTPLRQT